MNVQEFVKKYHNHPILFLGTGISLRYLKNSYTWDGLLEKVSVELYGNNEHYFDIKSKCMVDGHYDYKMIASQLEVEFNDNLEKNRDGKFKAINDEFYGYMGKGINQSRFKLYIRDLLNTIQIKEEFKNELILLKKVRKNIGSIITTNYDCLIESIFEFKPLIGNDILLSNPYGSLYKIHGCVKEPQKIIITNDDYDKFNEKYELIRAQLLSLFIHNPIIFLGYALGDDNVKDILKTIFTYIEPNTKEAEKIRSNFLLVEYEAGSNNIEVTDHDVDMNGFATIRINKIKTDNFEEIYKHLSELNLPVSAMDIRKVQNVVREIYSGGNIKVSITEDLDNTKNHDKVLAIGTVNTIKYEYQNASEMMANYFSIIDESNYQLLELINKHRLSVNQYFPCFAFSNIQPNIKNIDVLKKRQIEKIKKYLALIKDFEVLGNKSISEILADDRIAFSNKNREIINSIENNNIGLDELEVYLREFENKIATDYKRLICYYDIKKYAHEFNIEASIHYPRRKIKRRTIK